jgi:hypothetical protein
VIDFMQSCAVAANPQPSDDEVVDHSMAMESILANVLIKWVGELNHQPMQSFEESVDTEAQSGASGAIDIVFRRLSENGWPQADLEILGGKLTNLMSMQRDGAISRFEGRLS